MFFKPEISSFYSFLGDNFGLPGSVDPDPLTQLNPDPKQERKGKKLFL